MVMHVRDRHGHLAAIRSPDGGAAPPAGYRPVGAPYWVPTRRGQTVLGLIHGLLMLLVLDGVLSLLVALLGVSQGDVVAFWPLWLVGVIAFVPIHRLAHEALHAACFRRLVGVWPRMTVWGRAPSISYPDWYVRRNWFLTITLAPLVVLPPTVLAVGGLTALVLGLLGGHAAAAAVVLLTVFLVAVTVAGALADLLEAWYMRRAAADALVNVPHGRTAQAYAPLHRSEETPGADDRDAAAPPA